MGFCLRVNGVMVSAVKWANGGGKMTTTGMGDGWGPATSKIDCKYMTVKTKDVE